MKNIQPYRVLEKMILTEKSSLNAGECAQYVFRVASKANKLDIKHAVESFFDVQVRKVSVLRMKPKVKRFRQRLGVRSGWKKAYVVLKEGNSIDIADSSL